MAKRARAEAAARPHKQQHDQFARLGILGEMASLIAHELNQPLAAIANYAEGLTRAIDRGGAAPAFLRNGASGIPGQAERAAGIIRRIRALLHRREADARALDLNAAARQVLEFFHAAADRRGLRCNST